MRKLSSLIHFLFHCIINDPGLVNMNFPLVHPTIQTQMSFYFLELASWTNNYSEFWTPIDRDCLKQGQV